MLSRAKKYKVYSWKHLFWHHRLQLSFVYKNMSQIYFKLFCSGDQRLLLDFFRKICWIHIHDVRFPKNLGSAVKFKKLWYDFVDKKNDCNGINISLSLESPLPFCLRKKIPEKAFLTLKVNFRKIIEKNNLCHPKQ